MFCQKCCLAEYPVTDLYDQSALFRYGDELCRADEAACWMLPSEQSFGFAYETCLKIHNRLKYQAELASFQCIVQIIGQTHAVLRYRLHGLGVIAVTVAACILGCIHRLVGIPEQCFYFRCVGRINRDADADRNID